MVSSEWMSKSNLLTAQGEAFNRIYSWTRWQKEPLRAKRKLMARSPMHLHISGILVGCEISGDSEADVGWNDIPHPTPLVLWLKGLWGERKGNAILGCKTQWSRWALKRGVKSQKVPALGRATCSIKNRYKNSGFHSTCGVSDMSRYPKQLVVPLPHGGKRCLLILWPTLSLAQGPPISLACFSPQS